MPEERFDQWAVLELMGHRRMAGRVSEEEIGGATFIRIDVPGIDRSAAYTQYYSPAAVYSIIPTSEEIVERFIRANRQAPITPWDIEEPLQRKLAEPAFEEYDEEKPF